MLNNKFAINLFAWREHFLRCGLPVMAMTYIGADKNIFWHEHPTQNHKQSFHQPIVTFEMRRSRRSLLGAWLPVVVTTWNNVEGADLKILHYRALVHNRHMSQVFDMQIHKYTSTNTHIQWNNVEGPIQKSSSVNHQKILPKRAVSLLVSTIILFCKVFGFTRRLNKKKAKHWTVT